MDVRDQRDDGYAAVRQSAYGSRDLRVVGSLEQDAVGGPASGSDLVEGGNRSLGVGVLDEAEPGPDGSRSNRPELRLDGLAVRGRETLGGLDDDVEDDGAGSEP